MELQPISNSPCHRFLGPLRLLTQCQCPIPHANQAPNIHFDSRRNGDRRLVRQGFDLSVRNSLFGSSKPHLSPPAGHRRNSLFIALLQNFHLGVRPESFVEAGAQLLVLDIL